MRGISTVKHIVSTPARFVTNSDTPLEIADLIFIDPVGTEYSRLFKTGKAKDYWSNEADARSVTLFIEHWLDKHRRFQSPKFLLGESYGTVRASIVSQLLTGGVSSEHFPSPVTPMGATEHMTGHATLPQDRVEIYYYPSGHEVYVGDDNARKFNHDIQDFIRAAH